ncbi:hypothetical protein ACFO0N_18615 [Halobium salinum]|uniref:Uncharacterized protein n=1 Tax=Halobium salinum TaxID=1364940 RepID=A0ABD5PH50_9EURY|nr:hypothetical protein [Halobium salinum]
MVHDSGAGVTTAIVVVKTGVLVFGGLITYFALKAYRRTGAPALRSLAIGFGVITFGSLVSGLLDQMLPLLFGMHSTLGLTVLLDGAFTLIGFVVITYSLYAE